MTPQTLAAPLAALAVFIPALCHAQATASAGAYGALGYANAHAEGADLGAVQARLGYRFNNWLGVEGEFASDVSDDKSTLAVGTGTITSTTRLQHEEAVYGVAFLPVSPNFDLLARAGYGHTRIKVDVEAVGAPVLVPDSRSLGVSDDSWNFGVGAQYRFDGQNGLRGDYTRQQLSGGGVGHADVWSVAYVRRF